MKSTRWEDRKTDKGLDAVLVCDGKVLATVFLFGSGYTAVTGEGRRYSGASGVNYSGGWRTESQAKRAAKKMAGA